MAEKFKILTQFVKDMSSETPDVQTYLYVKEYLKNYNLNIDITTKPLKNRIKRNQTKTSNRSTRLYLQNQKCSKIFIKRR